MSNQPSVQSRQHLIRCLEQRLHFPAIISPDFVFFKGEKQLTAQHVRIGRALEALSFDGVPQVAATWPPIMKNVSSILECLLVALPELRFRSNLPVIDAQSLSLILSHLRSRYGSALVKDSKGSILVNEEVVAFVVIKYFFENPYMEYHFDTIEILFHEDDDHPGHDDAGIVHQFHQLIADIRSVIGHRVGIINQFGRRPVIQPVAHIQDVRQAQRSVSNIKALVSNLSVINNPVANNAATNSSAANTPDLEDDETNRVSSDVSFSFVMTSPADKVPYKVFFPQKMLQDLYHQAFPSGHNTDEVEEEGYLTGVTHAIVTSMYAQTVLEAPGYADFWMDIHDETLVKHDDWDGEVSGAMQNRFPPNFPEAVRCLYNWGVNLEQPRRIQLMLWAVGTGPGPMTQIHEDPTDYVWISCAPPDLENEWCYGTMLRKPARAVEDPNLNNTLGADDADSKPSLSALEVEPQEEMTWERVYELAHKILDDHKSKRGTTSATSSLELARVVLDCMVGAADWDVEAGTGEADANNRPRKRARA